MQKSNCERSVLMDVEDSLKNAVKCIKNVIKITNITNYKMLTRV